MIPWAGMERGDPGGGHCSDLRRSWRGGGVVVMEMGRGGWRHLGRRLDMGTWLWIGCRGRQWNGSTTWINGGSIS